MKHQCFPCIWYVTIFRRRNQIRKRCYSQEALDALNSIFWGCRYGLTQGGSEPVGFWPQALEWRPALENRVQAPRVTQGPTPHPPASAEAPRPHSGTSWASCTRCVDGSHLLPLHLPAAWRRARFVTPILILGSGIISTRKPSLDPWVFLQLFLYRILEKYLCMCLSPFLAPFTFTRVFIYQVPFWAPGDRQPGFLTFENSRSGLLLLNLYPLRTHETEHGPMLLSAVPPLW